jgi:formylmethanofuran dehydrogenase subunit E
MVNFEKIIEFHGHLGPYLVLGYRAGELALEKLSAEKHFGIEVTVHCPDNPPPRCFIDGIQLSTGATFGKNNLFHQTAPVLSAVFKNRKTEKTLTIRLTDAITKQFLPRKGPELEAFARKVAELPVDEVFIIE